MCIMTSSLPRICPLGKCHGDLSEKRAGAQAWCFPALSLSCAERVYLPRDAFDSSPACRVQKRNIDTWKSNLYSTSLHSFLLCSVESFCRFLYHHCPVEYDPRCFLGENLIVETPFFHFRSNHVFQRVTFSIPGQRDVHASEATHDGKTRKYRERTRIHSKSIETSSGTFMMSKRLDGLY